MTSVHRLQHVERLRAANLADDRSGLMKRTFLTARGWSAPSPRCCLGLQAKDVLLVERNSAASSMVTIGRIGIAVESALSNVVLPVPVPPEIKIFSSAMMHSSNSADSFDSVPAINLRVSRR